MYHLSLVNKLNLSIKTTIFNGFIFLPFSVDPPSPVNCPLGGRYSFIQNANGILERYSTKIRGVTPRPRVQINCRIIVSEFKSCSQDGTRIEIDEEYCESVDYRGRPIGEYGESTGIQSAVNFKKKRMPPSSGMPLFRL